MFSNYAKMDEPVINRNMERFNKPSDMDLPIDDYFSKQEEVRRLRRTRTSRSQTR